MAHCIMHLEVAGPSEPDEPTRTVPTLAIPVAMGVARATLTILAGLDAGRTILLADNPVVLGSAAGTDVRVDDPGLSRKHARVVRSADDAFWIEDLGSTNGTYVGSRRVIRARLASGDLVQLGPHLVL